MKMQQVEIQSVGRLGKESKDLNEAINKSELIISNEKYNKKTKTLTFISSFIEEGNIDW
jgi:hypothetical protein